MPTEPNMRIPSWIVQAILGFSIAVGGYFIQANFSALAELDSRQRSLEVWQAEVKGSRFTASDGLMVWKEITQLKTEVATPKEPPSWFVKRMDTVELKLDQIDQRLRRVEAEKHGNGAGASASPIYGFDGN